MGKPFKGELKKLSETIRWAEQQDVTRLAQFLFAENKQIPLVCIGSGGSLSACHYAVQLYQQCNGVLAQAMTPLLLMYAGHNIIRSSKLLFLSASGKNKDILSAIKYGVKYNETGMMSLTLRKNNPTEELLEQYPKVQRWCEDIPSEKDGFLATNSLLATFTLLCKAACASKFQVSRFKLNDLQSETFNLNLSVIQNFIVMYGATGEPVAWDIESKLTEAALGSALLSDYRNFGHGRHHWFDKRGENSCIIALVTPVERELAYKTIGCLPKSVPVIYIETELDGPQASIDMLLKAFRFVNDLGEARGIDPGKPGVPGYGRLLYNLDYYKLTNRILPAEKTLDVAVLRKLGVAGRENAPLWVYYSEACQRFVRQLNRGRFTTVAFDYDGTLSASDRKSRFTNGLCDEIRDALMPLLENGIQIVVATGRGKSVGESFKESIDQKYWLQIKVGYYNGAYLLALGDEDELKKWKKQPFDSELKELEEELKLRLPAGCVGYKFEERSLQLSIEGEMTQTESQLVYDTCREIIWDKQMKGIRVWRSSHSMDIVVYREVSKLRMIEDPEQTLCIGDYGTVEGNDYEMLTSKYSLSVDRVSKNIESCWNIAPSGMKGLDATLYYISRMKANEGKITCKFSV
ncbi:HAD hydrolase family protein [Bacteroides heparinolyticus]|uniref:HAD hydrolase family protein n=1 Tax=Prevotella heparinolytica TaxID=28113 RepID=UPI003FA09CCD